MRRLKLLGATIIMGLAAASLAQTTFNSSSKKEGPGVYEDDELRVTIPAGWIRASSNYPSLEPYRAGGIVVVGNAVLQADARLLLQKDGYTLALAYRTQHASGVLGGRFVEAFNLPWLSPDRAESCSAVLTHRSQPATSALLFENMLIDNGSANVREQCGVPNDVLIGEQRWYGGYFTHDRGYFFDESCEGCGSKLYSLTSAAETPAQLPAVGDLHLKKMIAEAIDIVESIHYKRCAAGLCAAGSR